MNRKFYLIDRENGNAKRRITLQEIADHFNGDGSSPVRWSPANVDLDRFRDEMDEIGYTFVIEHAPGPQTARDRLKRIEARLATAYAKLQDADMPNDRIAVVNQGKCKKGWLANDGLRMTDEPALSSREFRKAIQGSIGFLIEDVGSDHTLLYGITGGSTDRIYKTEAVVTNTAESPIPMVVTSGAIVSSGGAI